jgi:hypothetical protein
VHNTLEKGSRITTREESPPQPHPEAPK